MIYCESKVYFNLKSGRESTLIFSNGYFCRRCKVETSKGTKTAKAFVADRAASALSGASGAAAAEATKAPAPPRHSPRAYRGEHREQEAPQKRAEEFQENS